MKNVISALFLFFLLTISIPVFAEKNQVTFLDPINAKEYAELFIKNELGVTPQNLNIVFEVFDTDDSVLGYYLTYTNEDNENHYIIISATTDRTPILEYGQGIIEKSNDNGDKLYYLGALNYWYAPNKEALEVQFEKTKESFLQNLNSKLTTNLSATLDNEEKLELNETIKQLKSEKIKSFGKGNYEKEWGVLESYKTSINKSRTIDISATNDTYGLPITRVWQRMSGVNHQDSACGPTSGVIVANYVKQKGYSIRDSNYYGGDAAFINHFWDEMAWYWGATMGNYRSTMEEHLNLNYSTKKFNVTTKSLNKGDFSTYKSWIKGGFPVTIRFNNITAGLLYWSGWHFVVGGGYQTTSSGDFIGVKNPDGGQNNTGYVYFAYDPNYDVISFSVITVN